MDSKEQAEQLRRDIEALRDEVEKIREADTDILSEIAKQKGPPAAMPPLKCRRVLKGHFGKIYAMHWSRDSRHLVSASQDGKLIIWNAFTTNKIYAVPLRSSWVMTCAYAPGGQLVACGGLDNTCSVYKVDKGAPDLNQVKPLELTQHEGYLSSCRFVTDAEMLTASGDSTCILWDIERKSVKAQFSDHTGDVMSVAPFDRKDLFVSGSCDSTAKVWDMRGKKACVATYTGHESDINCVQWFPTGDAFASGSDDSTIRLNDLRSYRRVQVYANPDTGNNQAPGVTCLDFSHNGARLYGGYDDFNCIAWNTLHGTAAQALQVPHDNRVSTVGVSFDGKALCTGSWDTYLKLWA